MFGQIEATGRKVGGRFSQKCPNFENFAWTKVGGFGKIWDQTFMGIIRGPTETRSVTVSRVGNESRVFKFPCNFFLTKVIYSRYVYHVVTINEKRRAT